MKTECRASWAAVLLLFSVHLAGCSDSRSTSGLPTLNFLAPTDAAAGGLVPAVGPPLGPYFTNVFCGGYTTKVGALNLCGVEIDKAHWAQPWVKVWADFSAFGPPYTSEWTMAPCGVCGQTHETDFKVHAPGEYHIVLYVRDGDGRMATVKRTVWAVQ
jgi:hypothetical protein